MKRGEKALHSPHHSTQPFSAGLCCIGGAAAEAGRTLKPGQAPR